ncbi:amidohydrolase family protein [Kolteria novifilia]
MSGVQHYRARWTIPISQPPIAGGSIAIANGRIQELGESRQQPDAIDLGDVAILPGLVNAHAHLDLPTLPQIEADASFTRWLSHVVAWRRSASNSLVRSTIETGLAEVVQSGTTLVGDITTSSSADELLAASGIGSLRFREVLGLSPARYEPLWNTAGETLGGPDTSLSLHAPFSTSRELYRRVNADSFSHPIATHWMETREEREFLRSGRGPIHDFLDSVGAIHGLSPAELPCEDWSDYLDGPGNVRWILVHGNYISHAEITRLASPPFRERVAGVVYCPRTHARFRHAPHPFEQLMEAGIPVALGTDSRASSPNLSLFDEGRFLAEIARDLDPRKILAMMTLHGARVLGREATCGALETGKSADLTIVKLPVDSRDDPAASVLHPDAQVVGTMVGGNWRWKRNGFAEHA